MNDVSVIIPTWNRAATLEKAITSALEQTFPPLEVLVCDDGSTDDSREIVNSINDSRVRWIEGPRGGRPAIPRNRGIRDAKGEWLAFLDSDDQWLPEKIEKQLDIAENFKNCRAVSSNAYRFIPNKGIVGNLLEWNKEIISFNDLLKLNYIICSSTLIHSSIFKKVIGFPEYSELEALEDYALWFRVLTQTDFIFMNEPLIIYTDDHINSIRSKGTNNFYIQRKFVFNNFLEWAKTQECLNHSYVSKIKTELLRDFCGNIVCSAKKNIKKIVKLKV